MRFEIVIDDDDRDDAPETPWNAALFPIISWDGKTGELLAAGIGRTPQAAVEDLLKEPIDWEEDP